MALARIRPAMTWARSAPPATPNVVVAVSATTVATAAAMNAPTTLSQAILLTAVSPGRTDAMTAGQIATVVPTKMRALTAPPMA